MLVIFSGNIFNPHGIKEITNGTRYVHTAFWSKHQLPGFPVGFNDNAGTLDKFWE
jgi:hypothetical protein